MSNDISEYERLRAATTEAQALARKAIELYERAMNELRKERLYREAVEKRLQTFMKLRVPILYTYEEV